MKLAITSMLTALFAVVLAGSAFAQGPDGPPPRDELPYDAREFDEAIGGLGLKEDQKGKYEQIYKQHAPVLQKHFQQQQSIYTPEQKIQYQEAGKKAKEQGLKGKEYHQFAQKAVKFTPDQQKQYIQCETDIAKEHDKFYGDVEKILTPEQQEKIPKHLKKGKGKEPKKPLPPPSK
jgi:Spy/CpxP family protein refolding chaperone